MKTVVSKCKNCNILMYKFYKISITYVLGHAAVSIEVIECKGELQRLLFRRGWMLQLDITRQLLKRKKKKR